MKRFLVGLGIVLSIYGKELYYDYATCISIVQSEVGTIEVRF